MSHHYIKKCRHCFRTIAQCRCGNQKEVRWDVCQAPACQAQEKAHAAAATRVDIGPVAATPMAHVTAELAQANAAVLQAAERERQLVGLLRATEEKLALANDQLAALKGLVEAGAFRGPTVT